jgi:AcrR family transcriptional regulator
MVISMSNSDLDGNRIQPEGLTTRERILYEASLLFRRAGYFGTTTRDIAKAVGIQQPSLFYHFPSKSAIVTALFQSDLDHALAQARVLAKSDASAAARLYRYISDDIERIATSTYDLSGLYREDVLDSPEFEEWASKRQELHAAVDSIIEQAVEAGEFVAIRAEIVREMIVGALARASSLYSGRGRAAGGIGGEIATVLVRGLLVDATSINRVRVEAEHCARRDELAF